MSANVITFEGQYMADQMRNIDRAKTLTEEAMSIIKSTSQHRNWRCNETREIDNGIDIISQRLQRLDMGIIRTGNALGRGLVSFTELEQRSESQANTLSSNLQNNYGFEATDRTTNSDTTLPTLMLPTIPMGRITVEILTNWFKEVNRRIKEFWDNFFNRNRKTDNNGYQTPTSDDNSGTVTPPVQNPEPKSNTSQENTQQDETSAYVETSAGEIYPASFERAMPLILENEGGYVWHPKDPGGETNMGITRATFDRARQQGIIDDSAILKDLSVEDATKIYYEMYWKPSNADKMPPPLDAVYFDAVINLGNGRHLQRALNRMGASLADDGYVGPQTLAALDNYLNNSGDVLALCDALCDERQETYEIIAANNPDLAEFLGGWTRRVDDVRRYAHNYA